MATKKASTSKHPSSAPKSSSHKKESHENHSHHGSSHKSHSHEDHSSHTTTDHEEIRHWAEQRGAKPSCVKGTGSSNDVGLLRIDFPGYSGGDSLQEITWDEFFEKFDEQGLALLYQKETAAGEKSNFNKLVSRKTADQVERKSGKSHSEHGRGTH